MWSPHCVRLDIAQGNGGQLRDGVEHLDLGGDEDKQGHGSCRQVQGGLHLVGRQGAPATPGGGADARLSRVSSEQGAGNGRGGLPPGKGNRPQIGVFA